MDRLLPLTEHGAPDQLEDTQEHHDERNHPMTWSRRGALLGLAATAGCTVVGPDYKTPESRLEGRFVTGGSASAGDVSSDPWWKDFKDARLNGYAERGLAANLNVKAALARLDQAEARVRQTGLATQASGGASGSSIRSGGENVPTTTTETYALSGSFVFDLFGGVQRGREQSLAQLEAAGFSVGDARLALLSAVVSNYIAARFHQTAAELTRRSVQLRQRTLSLVESQLNEGAATRLDVIRAQADLEATQADLPGFIAGFNASVFAIAALLDQPNRDILGQMQRGAPQPWPRSDRANGVPANLLRNVPAIRVQERQLAASVAAIGVAEAQLYPSLTLSGSIGAGTTDRWSFGPEISVPVLNQPLLRARRDEAIAVAKEAELNWRSAVVRSVEQVEVAASNLSNNRRQVSLLRKSVASQERSLELTRGVYQNGAVSLLDLIETERSTLGLQVSLAAARRDAANAWVQLQVATGRGWNV